MRLMPPRSGRIGSAFLASGAGVLWKTWRRLSRCTLLLVAAILLALAPRTVGQVSGETRDALDVVIEALKAVRHPASAVGTAVATVTREGYDPTFFPEREELHVTFRFKDHLRRSDVYELSEDRTRGPFKITWTRGPENSVVYDTHGADVRSEPASEFFREFGRDFHPEVFQQYVSLPLQDLFERLKTIEGVEVSVGIGEDGLVHIVSDYKKGDGYAHRDLCLDPEIGYRLVRYTREEENLHEDEPKRYRRYEAEWKQREGEWFVEKAVLEEGGERVVPEDGAAVRKPFKSRP